MNGEPDRLVDPVYELGDHHDNSIDITFRSVNWKDRNDLRCIGRAMGPLKSVQRLHRMSRRSTEKDNNRAKGGMFKQGVG